MKRNERQRLLSRTACAVLGAALLAGAGLSAAMPAGTAHADSPAGYDKFDPSPLLKNYKTDWFGNSFSGESKWVQNWIYTMNVSPSGAVVTNANWDEGGDEVSVYKDGDKLGAMSGTHASTDGQAAADNDKYLWASLGKRIKKTDMTGHTTMGAIQLDSGSRVSGLAATASELFVGNSGLGKIQVFDAETNALKREWNGERPGPLVIAGDGTVWTLQLADQNGKRRLLHYAADGSLLPETVTFADSVVPTAIGFNPVTRQLLVADDGINQQVLLYDPSSIAGSPTTPTGTFGDTGGIFSGIPGANGPLKLHDLRGVGADSNGNYYVGMGAEYGGTELRSFKPDGTLRWELHGLEFVDNGDLDPRSETDVYTKGEHWTKDYGEKDGKGWTYQGYTINRFKYPDDPRLHDTGGLSTTWIRWIGGQKYMFLTDMYASTLTAYRFDPATDGEVAIPAMAFSKVGLIGGAGLFDIDWLKVGDTTLEAEQASGQSGTDVYDAGAYKRVGWSNDGDYLRFDNVDFGSGGGVTSVDARVSAPNANSKLELRLDAADGPVIGSLDVPATGSSDTMANVTVNVQQTSGRHTLYLFFRELPNPAAVPSSQPRRGEWIWVDKDGDGQFDADEYSQLGTGENAPGLWGWQVDDNGDIWQATDNQGLRKFAFQGVNAAGAPEYDYAHMATEPMPAPYNNLQRSWYDPATDTMYLTGYADDNKNTTGEWKGIGRVLTRFDHWSDPAARTLKWRIDLSGDQAYTRQAASMSIAGDYLFVAYTRDARVQIYDKGTGALLGHFVPGAEVGFGDKTGWLDVPYAITARRLSSGEYVIFTEEDLRAKQMMYRWDGADFTPDTSAGGPGSTDTFSAPRRVVPVSVDGKLDEAGWPITKPIAKPAGGTDNNTVAYGAMWDDDYLYLGATVKDEQMFSESSSAWENDAVEFYIDGNDDKNGGYDSHDAQYIMGYRFDADRFFASNGKKDKVKRAWAPIDGGYSVELAIPWSDLDVKPKAGSRIGIDAGNDDDDDGGGREGSLIGNSDGNAYSNNSAFSDLLLVDERKTDDNDAVVRYEGRWGLHDDWSDRYGSTTHESNSAGTSVSFDFVGTGISLIGERQQYGGSADVYIDGKLDKTVSFRGDEDTSGVQQMIYEKAGLAPGPHTFKMIVKDGGYSYVDALLTSFRGTDGDGGGTGGGTDPGQGTTELRVDTDRAIVEQGEAIHVLISAPHADDLYGFDLTVQFDAAGFELQSVERGADFGTGAGDSSLFRKDGSGTVRLVGTLFGQAHGASGDAQLLKLTFRAKDKTGRSRFALAAGGRLSSSAAVLSNAGSASAELATARSDLTGGGVRIDDVVLVARAFGKSRGHAGYEERLDMNGDGVVNVVDIAYIANRAFLGS